MLLGAKLQHSMQHMGNKNNNHVYMGNKINTHIYKKNALPIQNKPISYSQSPIEIKHIKN